MDLPTHPSRRKTETRAPWCAKLRCERFADAAHALRQPASSLALLLSILERRSFDPALAPTLRAAQSAVENLSLLLPAPDPAADVHRLQSWQLTSEADAQAELWPRAATVEHCCDAPEFPSVVLLVEDNADVAAALATFLEDEGYEVRISSGTHEAMQKLVSGCPIAAVVSDFGLPGPGNGLEVLHQARQRFPQATLVLMTGDPTPELVCATRDDGIGLLPKPLNTAALLRALRA